MSATDLWGELPTTADMRLPKTVLVEQASLLGPKTNNVLEGRVHSWKKDSDFIHELEIVVPALDNYVYSVALIRHKIDLYPVRFYDTSTDEPQSLDVNTEEQLVDALRSTLSSERVKRVIASLLTQAREQLAPF